MRTSIGIHLHDDTEITVKDYNTAISGKFAILKLSNVVTGDLSLYPDDRKSLIELRDKLTEYLENTADGS